ncbi:hypothetical protein [Providencia rettgeri]|uniref:hypothetical protein n=1 Tax=Providencia rettgeri TaxID=587 RepID=UPI0023614649|nr:hypothetical protein [Providencia rettgeri]
MRNEPPPRYETAAAIQQLVIRLNLSNEIWMQDWAYIVAKPEHIDSYLSLYYLLSDEDQKFTLMMVLLQALEEQDTQSAQAKYEAEIRSLLLKEYSLHAYTIFHWCCFDNDDLSDCWKITPMMREIYDSQNNPDK